MKALLLLVLVAAVSAVDLKRTLKERKVKRGASRSSSSSSAEVAVRATCPTFDTFFPGSMAASIGRTWLNTNAGKPYRVYKWFATQQLQDENFEYKEAVHRYTTDHQWLTSWLGSKLNTDAAAQLRRMSDAIRDEFVLTDAAKMINISNNNRDSLLKALNDPGVIDPAVFNKATVEIDRLLSGASTLDRFTEALKNGKVQRFSGEIIVEQLPDSPAHREVKAFFTLYKGCG